MSKIITDLYNNAQNNIDFDDYATPMWDNEISNLSNHIDFNDRSYGQGELISIESWYQANRVAARLSGEGTEHQIINSFSDEEKSLIEGATRHRGFEASAFYKSFRFKESHPYPGEWGIFYMNDSIHYIASQILSYYPTWSNPLDLALTFLKKHESHHFHADLQTLNLEILANKPLYAPIRKALRGMQSQFVEEAIANRKAHKFAKQKGITEFAEDFMDIQPAAYSRYKESEQNLLSEWASITVDFTSPMKRLRRSDLSPWLEKIPSKYDRESICPQHIIYADLPSWLPAVLKMPEVILIVESTDFSKSIKKLHSIKKKWEATKIKLCENCISKGLNFYPWTNTDSKSIWSARVDDNFRAHLRNLGDGVWEAVKIGNHKAMGHG